MTASAIVADRIITEGAEPNGRPFGLIREGPQTSDSIPGHERQPRLG